MTEDQIYLLGSVLLLLVLIALSYRSNQRFARINIIVFIIYATFITVMGLNYSEHGKALVWFFFGLFFLAVHIAVVSTHLIQYYRKKRERERN